MKCPYCDGPAVLGNESHCTDGLGCMVEGRMCVYCTNLFQPKVLKGSPSMFLPKGEIRWVQSDAKTCSTECWYAYRRLRVMDAKGPAMSAEERKAKQRAAYHRRMKRLREEGKQ